MTHTSSLSQEDVVMSPIENDQEVSAPLINNPPNIKYITKRILCELIKTDIDENERQTAYEISKKLDNLIELILNKCDNKIHFIQLFMCFIVEINSELIRILPEYQNLSEDVNMRFIIPAKNIYNFALEVYFSIHDLFNVKLIIFNYTYL